MAALGPQHAVGLARTWLGLGLGLGPGSGLELGLGLGLGLGFARTRLAVREEARVLACERRLQQRYRALSVHVTLPVVSRYTVRTTRPRPVRVRRTYPGALVALVPQVRTLRRRPVRVAHTYSTEALGRTCQHSLLRGGGPEDGGRELQVRPSVDRDPRTDALLAADAYLRSGVCAVCGWYACGLCVWFV